MWLEEGYPKDRRPCRVSSLVPEAAVWGPTVGSSHWRRNDTGTWGGPRSGRDIPPLFGEGETVQHS